MRVVLITYKYGTGCAKYTLLKRFFSNGNNIPDYLLENIACAAGYPGIYLHIKYPYYRMKTNVPGTILKYV